MRAMRTPDRITTVAIATIATVLLATVAFALAGPPVSGPGDHDLPVISTSVHSAAAQSPTSAPAARPEDAITEPADDRDADEDGVSEHRQTIAPRVRVEDPDDHDGDHHDDASGDEHDGESTEKPKGGEPHD